jgi:hypothetical protein
MKSQWLHVKFYSSEAWFDPAGERRALGAQRTRRRGRSDTVAPRAPGRAQQVGADSPLAAPGTIRSQ